MKVPNRIESFYCGSMCFLCIASSMLFLFLGGKENEANPNSIIANYGNYNPFRL